MVIIRGNPPAGTAADERIGTQKATSVLVEAARAPGWAFTKKEFIRAMLESANTGKPQKPIGTVLEINGQVFFDSADLERCVELKKELAAFVRGKLSAKTVAGLKEAACQMAMVPTPDGAYRFFPLNPSAVIGHGLMLLHDEKHLGADVKECRLQGCEHFFLVSDQVDDPSDPGRRHGYCSTEHQKAAGKTKGAKRTAKWRKNKAAERTAAKAAAKHR